MKQPKQCKGCGYFHKAGHSEGSALYKSGYNAWCCKGGRPAHMSVGECKLKGWRGVK